MQGSDRNSSNDYVDEVAIHDLPPIPSQPAATGSTVFERGDRVQFETSALPNDLVDDIYSMTPHMEYSKSGENAWESSWMSAGISALVTSSGVNASAGSDFAGFGVSSDSVLAGVWQAMRDRIYTARTEYDGLTKPPLEAGLFGCSGH